MNQRVKVIFIKSLSLSHTSDCILQHTGCYRQQSLSPIITPFISRIFKSMQMWSANKQLHKSMRTI